MNKYSERVKRQIGYWQQQVDFYGPDHPRYRPHKLAKYQHLIREFGEIADLLDSLPDHLLVDNPSPTRSSFQTQVGEPRRLAPAVPEVARPATYGSSDVPDELADLPPELLAELSESVKGETDPLIKIINGRGGTATLDEILIDLWRKYKEVGKRPIVSNKLYRLSRRGLCWAIPGKKGIYTTTKPTSCETPPTPAGSEQGPTTNEAGSAAAESAANAAPDAKTTVSSDDLKRRKFAGSSEYRKLFASTAIPPNRLT